MDVPKSNEKVGQRKARPPKRKVSNGKLVSCTCDRCKKEFKAKKNYLRCKKCSSYENCGGCGVEFDPIVNKYDSWHYCDTCCKKRMKACSICTKSYVPASPSTRDLTRCPDCYWKEKYYCKECNGEYFSRSPYPYDRKEYYADTEYCSSCISRRNRIMKDDPQPNDHKPKFRILVTYSIQEEPCRDCDFDLSDDESNKEMGEKTIEYPLIKAFSNGDIDRDGNVISCFVSGPLSYYNVNNGRSFCNTEIIYTIVKAKVMKAERAIDLDNDL